MPNWCDCTISVAVDDPNRDQILADFLRGIERSPEEEGKEDEGGVFAFIIRFNRILDNLGTIRPELQELLKREWTRWGWVNSDSVGGTRVVSPPHEWEEEDGVHQVNAYGGFTKWSPPTEFLAVYSSFYPDTTFTLHATIECEHHYWFKF
jgi:hypothetical protein